VPWRKSMSEQRKSLVEEINRGEYSISEVCRQYDVSRPTAYKWLKRSKSGSSFEEQSRKPLHSPNRTNPELEELVISARKSHPSWGSRKLKVVLERCRKSKIPSASTISAILHRHGLISKEASMAATPYKRFERETPNDLWQCDFKGHFGMSNGKRCYPLTVTDDCSRFNLCISAKENEQLSGVIASFRSMFSEYGLPRSVLCDNGNPWGVSASFGGYTQFEIFLMDFDVKPIHGRPLHPQTQGKEERFHRTLKRELLSVCEMENLVFAQEKFDDFRKIYNEIRPHCALDYAVPADKYEKSKRLMPKKIHDWWYPQELAVKKIPQNGYLRYKDLNVFFSEAFAGKNIAVLPSESDGIVEIIYRNFSLARINLIERSVISKKIIRRKE